MAFPFAFLQFINGAIDVAVIGVVAGPIEAGLYVVALNVVRPLLVLANTAGLLGFSEGSYGDALPPVRPILGKSIIAGVSWMPIAWFALPLIFGDSFNSSRPVALVLCLSSAVNMAYGYFSQRMLATGRAAIASRAEVGASVVTAVGLLTFSLWGSLEAIDAAVTSLLAYAVKLLILERRSQLQGTRTALQ